jgi:hypothetical protein
MRGDSRTHSGEDFEEMGGTNGAIRVFMPQHSSNAGSVFRVTKSHIGGVNKAEKPAFVRIILKNATKMVTLRQTMGI